MLETEHAQVDLIITDYYGNTASTGRVEVPGKSKLITLPELAPGYYEINVERRGVTVTKTAMAIITPYDFDGVPYAESDFGVCTHLERSGGSGWSFDLLNEISAMGAKFIRDDLEWRGAENPKGVYTFKFDEGKTLLDEKDMGFLHTSGFNNQHYDGGATPYTAEGQDGFANYVAAAKDYIGDRYMAVDVFNEFWGPEFGDRGDGPADSLPEYYVPLHKKTYDVMKAAYPEVLVLANFARDEANPDKPTLGWYEETLKLGVADYMDGIFIHPYYGRTYPPETRIPLAYTNTINSLHGRYNVTGKLIWATETGSNTTNVTEKEQAQFVPRSYALFKHYGIEKVAWYDFMDDGTDPLSQEHNFGFIRNKFNEVYGAYTPKPSYVAYAVMARKLTGLHYSAGSTAAGVYHYTFTGTDGKRVDMVWATTAAVKEIITSNTLTVTDIMGVSKQYTPLDGKVTLQATQDVLYIEGI